MRNLLRLVSLLIVVSFILFNIGEVESKDNSGSVSLILDSAEGFFISLRDGEYKRAWGLLSEKSHQTIIDDIYRSAKNKGTEIKKADIMKDFNSNGMICNNYWNSFVISFDPDIVLNDRVWEMEKIEPDHAVILLKKRAVTKLQMYKEQEQWRVGLVETFWTRKHLKTVKYIHSLFFGR